MNMLRYCYQAFTYVYVEMDRKKGRVGAIAPHYLKKKKTYIYIYISCGGEVTQVPFWRAINECSGSSSGIRKANVKAQLVRCDALCLHTSHLGVNSFHARPNSLLIPTFYTLYKFKLYTIFWLSNFRFVPTYIM
jgi:hypothetical protein